MKTVFRRTGIFLAIVSLAILLLFGITYMGGESTGPLEDFFTGISRSISKMEEKSILRKRQQSRVTRLDWFRTSLDSPQMMKHPRHLLLGAYDNNTTISFQPVVNLEDSLHTVFPLMHIYTAWGSNSSQRFPAAKVQEITSLGSVPVITWEPWLIDFSADDIKGIPAADLRDKGGLKAIADGMYDSYLVRWASEAAAAKHTILLRWAHEMNDPYRYPWGPQNNTGEAFKAAWIHVVDLFRKNGANNVLWVWSPHLAYGWFDAYYPGDAWVDWVGTGTLNYGTVASWSQWWSFDEIFAKHYEALAAFKKPMLLSEFGSLAVGGSRAEWYKTALTNFPSRYPMVKGLIYFNNHSDGTTTYQALDWSIQGDSAVLSAVKQAFGHWEIKQ